MSVTLTLALLVNREGGNRGSVIVPRSFSLEAASGVVAGAAPPHPQLPAAFLGSPGHLRSSAFLGSILSQSAPYFVLDKINRVPSVFEGATSPLNKNSVALALAVGVR